jgi:hypothetical protein
VWWTETGGEGASENFTYSFSAILLWEYGVCGVPCALCIASVASPSCVRSLCPVLCTQRTKNITESVQKLICETVCNFIKYNTRFLVLKPLNP